MKYLGIGLVYAWRYTFGALLPKGQCKYHPSCSQYAIDALRKHGLVVGSAKAGWRILRCNPWSLGGVDHVPPRKRPVWHQRLRSRLGGTVVHDPAAQPETQPNAQGA